MIYDKIQKAIEFIKTSNLKKIGRNTYSEYDYYTPEQVNQLVFAACKEFKLYTRFNLIRNEFGIEGELIVIELEDDKESALFKMASDVPQIKATNVAQQLGGAMTYTKRYMLMNVFEIVDNNLDFDTTNNTKPKKETEQKNNEGKRTIEVWASSKDVNAILKLVTDGQTKRVEEGLNYWDSENRGMSKANKELIKTAMLGAK